MQEGERRETLTLLAVQGLVAASGGEVDLEVGPQRAVEDDVVVAERQRVDSSPPGRDAITISHLRKEYPGHPPKVSPIFAPLRWAQTHGCRTSSSRLFKTHIRAWADVWPQWPFLVQLF